MGVRRSSVVIGVMALLVLVTVGAATASSGPLVIPIPGFAGSALRVGGVARLNDGGAIIAGSEREPGWTGWQPAIVRLRVDGSVDLGYATEGISRPRLGADMSATSVALDPKTGDAWIGVSRPGGAGAIVALDGDGRRAGGFGHGGVLWRAPPSAPTALAWYAGRLLIASGSSACSGCQISVVDPTTGKVLGRGEVAPGRLGAGARCVGGAVTSAALTSARTALLVFRGRRCGDWVVTFTLGSRGGRFAGRVTRSAALGGTAGGPALVAAFGPDLCLAASAANASTFGPFVARRYVFFGRRAPGGRLLALVAIGGGACAALIAEAHHPTTVVVQASLQRRQRTLDAVPHSVRALGMFRCHAHLLVIGAEADGRQSAGAVVAIPVRGAIRAQRTVSSSAPASVTDDTDGSRSNVTKRPSCETRRASR